MFLCACVWACVCVGWHEELDRKLSQHSLGELSKFGSKTTLNRRVRDPELPLTENRFILLPSPPRGP